MTVQFGEDTGPDRPPVAPSLMDMLQPQQNWAGPDRAGVTGSDLLGYLTTTFGSQPTGYGGDQGLLASGANSSYPMTAEAQNFMSRQKFPLDPNRIVYGGAPGGPGGGFRLDSLQGPDLFGGRFNPQTMPLSQIPKELQPLLAPSLVRYYKSQDYQGGAVKGQQSAPWTGFFAPPGAALDSGQFEHTWPGITHYDPWGRSMGEYSALYS